MASLEPGKRIADRYVLTSRLGDGGHAEVWAAQDELTGVQVALKFMHLRNFSAGEATVILRHEAQMVQRLEHSGMLRVDEPQRDGWLVFLPMEYAGGGDAARLRGAPWQETVPILLQVARVLEHAHSRGVVHRDIKPGNILFDSAGNVRVSDFGTASRMGSTVAMAAGSPFYASPQQLCGDAATTSDDVYGLGALAYDLLTRHPPYFPHFDLQRVQKEDPVRPVPAVDAPANLLDLVQWMLVREPQKRPNLRQVMLGLQQLQDFGAAEFSKPDTTAKKPRLPYAIMVLWFVIGASIASAAFLFWPQMSRNQALMSQVLQDQVVDSDRARGELLEGSELWDEAVKHYQAVLDRDPSLTFAQDGLNRSNRRSALDHELAAYLAAPEKLAEPGVRRTAERAVARGVASVPRAARLSSQIAELEAQLQKH